MFLYKGNKKGTGQKVVPLITRKKLNIVSSLLFIMEVNMKTQDREVVCEFRTIFREA